MLSTDPHLWRAYDPDAWRDNPIETKHRKLLRSQRLGDEGKDLKPGPVDRDRLNVSDLKVSGAEIRKYSDFPRQHHSLPLTRTFSGNSDIPSLVHLDHSQNFSNVLLGPIRSKVNRPSRNYSRCGDKKSESMMRSNSSGLDSPTSEFGPSLSRGWSERMTM